MPEQINHNQLKNINDLPIDIKIAILKKVVGSDRKELEKIQQVHPHWLFITKTNDFMTPIFDAEMKQKKTWQSYMSPTILARWHKESKNCPQSDNTRNEYYESLSKQVEAIEELFRNSIKW